MRTAQDHRGNRIEPFRQLGQSGGDLRNCTDDNRWCARLLRDSPDGRRVLRIVVRGRGLFARSRHYRYVLPTEFCCANPGRSFSIWDEIVREPLGGALVGLVSWQRTGERPGLFSHQRRLLLLRVPPEDGGLPVPVLEAPLSGHIEQPVCPYPGNEYYEIAACQDQFSFSTLWTLVPSIAPIEPANLIMVATARTMPGRRTRADGPTPRAPIERTGGDDTPDPDCTFTRSFYFDEALGRYLPDAPLPACRDYLEP